LLRDLAIHASATRRRLIERFLDMQDSLIAAARSAGRAARPARRPVRRAFQWPRIRGIRRLGRPTD
jgi:hypothetical protein